MLRTMALFPKWEEILMKGRYNLLDIHYPSGRSSLRKNVPVVAFLPKPVVLEWVSP
jgi:hypothetical protein